MKVVLEIFSSVFSFVWEVDIDKNKTIIDHLSGINRPLKFFKENLTTDAFI